MWVRGCVFALVLAGCYSPSFETCSLACAANDVCPNGFECSLGRCAIAGTTCGIDAGSDGAGADNNAAGCGDGQRVAGEICFVTSHEIDTNVSNIDDAQLIDGNGDGLLDLAFLNGANYLFRHQSGGTFEASNTMGPAAAGASRMSGVNLDGNGNPELIHNDPTLGVLEIARWTGIQWSRVDSVTSEASDARAIVVGKVAGAQANRSIVMVFASRLRAFLLQGGNNITPVVQAGTGVEISGGRDVALGDFNTDGVAEIVVASDLGIEVYQGLGNSLTPATSPPLTDPVDGVVTCNVDGAGASDIVYVIKAVGTRPGRVGVARWNPQNTQFELPIAQEVPGMVSALECSEIDDDRFADAIVVATTGNGVDVLVLRGKSDGTFEPPIRFRSPVAFTQLRASSDYNNDGVDDIVLTSSIMGKITVLESDP